MLMVGLTLKHIKKVSVLKVNNTTNLPTKFIFVRFIAAAIAQIYNLLPAQYMLTFPEQVHLHAIFVRFAIVTHATGPMFDALVMIFGNADFMNWVFQKGSRRQLLNIAENRKIIESEERMDSGAMPCENELSPPRTCTKLELGKSSE
eukprot:Phypoly_transcript_15933.p1 GENE.Phypoly_transcript_15933~~Phypoly_transcript_15933.p1  ORF type:complete len:147 (+),score=16.43 Phypoly_transcript_15933:395-835(+)